MGFRTVCIDSLCKCTYKGGYLVVTKDNDIKKIHISEISTIIFGTNHTFISGYLLSELAENGIPVIFSDNKCLPVAVNIPLYGSTERPKRIKQQIDWSEPIKKRVWQHIVVDKIRRQSDILIQHNAHEVANQLILLSNDVKSGDNTNRESIAAALYFRALFGSDFSRNDDDAINSMLDYGYSLIMSKVSREIVSKGYITELGIHHHSIVNQWNLACDFMEPFRALIDNFVVEAVGEDLSPTIKHQLANILNQKFPYQNGSFKLSSIISAYVRDCFAALNREIPIDEISCYTIE